MSVDPSRYAAVNDESAAIAAADTDLRQTVRQERAMRKQAQQALLACQAQLALNEQLSGSASWRWELASDTVHHSGQLARLFGFDQAAPGIGFERLIGRIHADERALVEQQIYDALFDGQWLRQEFRVVLPDGGVRHLQSLGRAARNPDGQLEFLCAAMCVSQRKQADERLRLTQRELARVERIAMLGTFAVSIAHDVKQPLAAIALNAEAGLNWLAQQPPQLEQARRALRLVLQAGTSATGVIRSLRDMARKSGPERSWFSVDPAIGEVLSLLHGELHKHGVRLRAELTLDQQRLHADRIQFQQVIMNLLLNAVESMSKVHDRPRTLHLRSALADASGTLRISVEDNGAGIDSKAAGQLYEPLFSTKPDGMGMGLSICRCIVEAHGGRIWSTSRQPHGAAFHVSLPPRGGAPYATGEP
jgi:C4-dicarboxylate-specific signal transduction histidine kinase